MAHAIVLKLVREIRQDLPRAGVPKLHFMLQDKLRAHGIKMGEVFNIPNKVRIFFVRVIAVGGVGFSSAVTD